jgi:hypothetical protein
MTDRSNILEETRCLWKKPWWFSSQTPPPLTEEELNPQRDFCAEQIGVSYFLQGRRILIRSPLLSDENGVIYTEEARENDGRNSRIGLVLAKGRHCYPPSDQYGKEDYQVFCRVGDWVEYSFWEKTDSALVPNGNCEDGPQCYLVNDLHINGVIPHKFYPALLGSRF